MANQSIPFIKALIKFDLTLALLNNKIDETNLNLDKITRAQENCIKNSQFPLSGSSLNNKL